MDITAKITGIHYHANCCPPKLKAVNYVDFDINNMPTTCILEGDNFTYGFSKWVSPKRSRTYPYERVYNSLISSNKCVTVIPIVKDEGADGDRDFLQWDTISLMSLLDVYVILAHYTEAEKNIKAEIERGKKNKITNQQFDNDYVKRKLEKLRQYKSSSLHWNLEEMQKSLPELIDKVKRDHSKIEEVLGVKLKNKNGIDRFKKKIEGGLENFKTFSRAKAQEAQSREQQTEQPKEALSTLTKAKITITNYLGGEYYFTTDEIEIKEDTIFLIEGKHTKDSDLPSLGDIKDGFLKLMLYTNLEDVQINGKNFNTIPVLKLTSETITGSIKSTSSEEDIESFLSENSYTKGKIKRIKEIFKEAQRNNFIVIIEWGMRAKK